MELRHLRYFVAVAEALNFTKASARLRVAQPALSRQMTDLEDEIGVDLMKRSPRGVTLTAEGKLFLEEVRELLKGADESVEKVRALARGEYGELHVGYAPAPHGGNLPESKSCWHFCWHLGTVKLQLPLQTVFGNGGEGRNRTFVRGIESLSSLFGCV